MSESIPFEIAQFLEQPNVGNVVSRVFSGAELIGYHETKGLICVWYGGQGFNAYDVSAWGNGETGEVHHFNTADPSQLEDPEANARETMENYGFKVR